MPTGRPRGRPPAPPPLVFWRIRIDVEPPKVCVDHPELAKLLSWQIVLVKERNTKGQVVSEPLTGIRSHVLEDDGTKHRFLRRFGVAANPIHGYLVLETEPPAGAKAILRIRGAELPAISEYTLDHAEKVNKMLYEQPADQLAHAALERDDVRQLLLEMLSREPKPKPKKAASGGG